MRSRQLLGMLLFSGAGVLVVGMFLFTQQVVQRLSREIATTSEVFARFGAQASLPAASSPQVRAILRDVFAHIDFPIVITDTTGTPRAWRGVVVDPATVPDDALDSLAAGLRVSPRIAARVASVRAQIPLLDRSHAP